MIAAARSRCLGVSALAMATLVHPSPAMPLWPGDTSSLPDTFALVTPGASSPDGLFKLSMPIANGAGSSVMADGSTSPTAQAIRQTEPFEVVAYRSGSVFRAAPRGGVFGFAVAVPHPAPKLTRFLVGAQPVEIVTDQQLAAIVTSTDGFNEMPFYVILGRRG